MRLLDLRKPYEKDRLLQGSKKDGRCDQRGFAYISYQGTSRRRVFSPRNTSLPHNSFLYFIFSMFCYRLSTGADSSLAVCYKDSKTFLFTSRVQFTKLSNISFMLSFVKQGVTPEPWCPWFCIVVSHGLD